MAWKIAELFVEITEKGLTALKTQLGTLKSQLEQVEKGVGAVGRIGTYSFALLAGTLGGFVRAGMQSSAVGDILSFQMGQLSRNIAGLFLPEIQKLIQGISNLVQWFRGLSAEQRQHIAQWLMAALVMSGVAMMLPKLVAGIKLVISSVQALAVAIGFLEGETGIGALLPLIGFVVAAFASIALGSEVAQNGIGGLVEAFKPLMKAFASAGEVLGPIFEQIAADVEGIMPILGELAVSVMEVIASLFSALSPLIGLFKPLMELMVPVVKIISTLLQAIGTLLRPIVGLFVKIAEVLVSVIKPILEGLAWLVKKIAESIQWVIDKASKIPGFGWLKQEERKKPKDEAAKDDRRELMPSLGGFSNVESAYEKITQLSIKATFGGKSPEEKQQEALDKIANNTGETNQKLGLLKQPFRN